jgi:nucleoside-diphosphate-sugar epimerase
MRILIFGAGGYIGIPLAECLAECGHQVTAADRYFFGKYPRGCQIMRADIRSICADPAGWTGVDAIIDLAGLSNDASAEIDPDITRSINLDGAKNLATVAKQAGINRYIYSSSASVYGHGAHHDLKETDECKPLTLYAECKLRVEDHLRSLAGAGFQPTILRNATVFGPSKRMRFDLAVNIMTLRAWRDGVIYVMGGGEQWRPFICIDDVIAAFIHAVEDAIPGTYNIGHENLTIKDVSKIVKEKISKVKIHSIPDDVDKRSYHIAFARAADCGFKAKYQIRDVIPIMISMLKKGQLVDDPTCYTLQWYKSLLEWDNRLNEIRMEGRIL